MDKTGLQLLEEKFCKNCPDRKCRIIDATPGSTAYTLVGDSAKAALCLVGKIYQSLIEQEVL